MKRREPHEQPEPGKLTGGTACAQLLADIPTPTAGLQLFAEWMDRQLTQLEVRFGDYATIQSLGLMAGRHSSL